jgi:hypothetical protein
VIYKTFRKEKTQMDVKHEIIFMKQGNLLLAAACVGVLYLLSKHKDHSKTIEKLSNEIEELKRLKGV